MTAIKNSTLLLQRFKQLALEEDISAWHPVLDVRTRWLALSNMVLRALTLRVPLAHLQTAIQTDAIFRTRHHRALLDDFPTQDEWVILSQVALILKLASKVTLSAEGDLYLTTATAYVLVGGLEAQLRDPVGQMWDTLVQDGHAVKPDIQAAFPNGDVFTPELPAVRDFRHRFLAELHRKMDEVHDVSIRAILLDPRILRPALLTNALSVPQIDRGWELILQEMETIVVQNQGAEPNELLVPPEDAAAQHTANAELELFKRTPPLAWAQNPLKWWQQNATNFPRLAQLAIKYLGVPATSAPSERLFSTAGHVLTDERSRMEADVCEAIVMLHEERKLARKRKREANQ